MKRLEFIPVLLLSVLTLAFPAWGAPRTFVSGFGSDANDCSAVTTPCRYFPTALSRTDAGGELIVLDSAAYFNVTITKSVSIIAPPGVYAGIKVSSGSAITINAGANDIVTLRGLTLKGFSNAISGIQGNTVGTLIVEGCSISGFNCGFLCGNGITFVAPNSNLIVINSDISSNHYGLGIYNTTGSVKASIDHVHSENNGTAFDIFPSSSGTAITNITNSVASNNSAGFSNADNGGVARAVMNLEHCIASNNSYAGVVTSNQNNASTTSLSNCAILGNPNGILKGLNGTVYSRQNNTVTDSSVVPTPLSAW
jgi:hypothetical protein